MENLKLDFITAKNSILLLVDYQPSMFKGVESSDRTTIKNTALAAATAARILDVPVVSKEVYGKFDAMLSI